MVSNAEYEAAVRRGREMREHVPHAVAAVYYPDIDRVLVRLSSQLEIALNPREHQALHGASPAQLSEVELWGGGYELFFPKLDEGVYVPSLIQGILGSKRWMEEQAARDREEYAARSKAVSAESPLQAA